MGPLPKNLFIRLGAHRASAYGTSKSAKTTALAASVKDQFREVHAREFTGRHIRPKIIDKDIPDYQQLLDNAGVESPPHLARPYYLPGSPFHLWTKTWRPTA